MSDTTNSDEKDFDWNDALKEWESDPPPPKTASETEEGPSRPKPATSARALYQPPVKDAPRIPQQPPKVLGSAPRPMLRPASDSIFDAANDELPTFVPSGDEEFLISPGESTRVAGVSDLLIASTLRPEADTEPEGSEPPIRLDSDPAALLDELDRALASLPPPPAASAEPAVSASEPPTELVESDVEETFFANPSSAPPLVFSDESLRDVLRDLDELELPASEPPIDAAQLFIESEPPAATSIPAVAPRESSAALSASLEEDFDALLRSEPPEPSDAPAAGDSSLAGDSSPMEEGGPVALEVAAESASPGLELSPLSEPPANQESVQKSEVQTEVQIQSPLVLEDVEPPSQAAAVETAASSEPPSAAVGAPDRGAEAALRTVRARKTRPERFPLVGRGPEAARARAAFLRSLAERSEGPQKARLLISAAELLAPLGQSAEARALFQEAHQADPADLIALHALRRDAQSRRDPRELTRLLEHETELPIREETKAFLLVALAELHLRHLGDAAAAESAARRALALAPHGFVASLLLAETCLAQSKRLEAAEALERAASVWQDPRGRAALRVEAARVREQAGDIAGASKGFGQAIADDADALDAHLGLVRAARVQGETEAAAGALRALADRIEPPALREALVRTAARWVHLRGQRQDLAATWLEGASSPLALWAKIAAADADGNTASRRAALEALTRVSYGSERALADLGLAELHAAQGDLDATREALADAVRADPSLGLVRVVREILARQTKDVSALVSAAEEDAGFRDAGALVAAAKLAYGLGGQPGADALAREDSLLARAVEEGERPACAEVIRLDLALESGDVARAASGLDRESDLSPALQRAFRRLVFADRIARDDAAAADRVLRDFAGASPTSSVLNHAAMRASGADRATLWAHDAENAPPERAAFSLSMAGVLFEAEADGLANAALFYQRAISVLPTYAPALWRLEAIARKTNNINMLRDVHERIAGVSTDDAETAGRYVRAALLFAGDDVNRTGALLGKARAIRPDDVVIRHLSLRLVPSLRAGERAGLLRMDSDVGPAWKRASELSAAAVLEEAGEHAEAASFYRAVAEGDGASDPVTRMGLERSELGSGDVARVSDRRVRAVSDAKNDKERVAALEQLADLDLRERSDHASAVLSLQSILEIAPGHMASLRALERYFMEGRRDPELLGIEERFALHLTSGREVTGHARFFSRLAVRAAESADAADEMLLRVADRSELDLWMARRVEGAARSAHDLPWAQRASRAIAELAGAPIERASFATRAAEWLPVEAGPDAYAPLVSAVREAPDHPLAAETLAELELAAKRPTEAAEALELAARAAKTKSRAVRFWYHAALIWQGPASNADRALVALEAAASVDIAYEDVFARMAEILEARGEIPRLADLVDRRLAAGADGPLLVELNTTVARLRERLGDGDRARAALRAALAIEPDNLPLLRHLSNLHVQAEDWRGAAEVLIRIARLTKDTTELQAVFFRLGDIYDVQMPDLRRAEAAFARALKLQPDDIESMERLAQVYRKQENFAEAATLLARLVEVDPDPDKNQQHRFELADVLEKAGDLKGAERVLEATRRTAPTNLVVLHAIAQFYERNNVGPALAMHLNRASADFRAAIEADFLQPSSWIGLVDVLTWKKRPDAARAVASAAAAIGIVDVELARLLDPTGGVPGAGPSAAAAALDEIVAPALVGAATRQVFALAHECLEKSLPFEPKALRAEKLPRDHAVRARADEVARWFGFPGVEIFVTAAAPRVCVPVGTESLALLIGRDLLSAAEDREWTFLLTRAIKIARSGLAIAVRSQPSELALLMGGLFRSYDPNWSSPLLTPAALEDMTKRIQKHLPRRVRDDLYPSLLEMSGLPGFDPLRIGVAASELGDRIALIAVGSAPAAIGAHVKLAGLPATSPRSEAVRRIAATRALLTFAISDAHFLGRQQAGVDRG